MEAFKSQIQQLLYSILLSANKLHPNFVPFIPQSVLYIDLQDYYFPTLIE